VAAPNSSFWSGLRGVFSAVGGGWYPTSGGATEGAPPFRGTSSDAGPEVSAGSALQLAAAWACVRLISQIIGSLPLSLYHKNDAGKLELATGSITHKMLHDTPNTEMTAATFWKMMTAGILLWGNSYALLTRVAGRVASMTPLRPEFMTVFRNDRGQIRYAYLRGTVRVEYAAEDILHLKGFSVDGLVGLSPVAVQRQTIGRSIATDQASGGIFKTGLSVSGFIKYAKAFVDTEQRDDVRAQVQRFTGSANVGGVMVLENGMEYQPMSMNPADAQMLESRQFNVEEVCRVYGVPPQLIGHLSKASSWASSLENTTLGFLKFCVGPMLRDIEQELRRSLQLPASSVLKFNLDALLRGDSAARAALWASGLQNGWLTRNEVRDDEDRDHSTEPNADKLTVQANMALLEKVGETPPAAASPEPDPAVDPKP
jgi:HK97 family phage portal protein